MKLVSTFPAQFDRPIPSPNSSSQLIYKEIEEKKKNKSYNLHSKSRASRTRSTLEFDHAIPSFQIEHYNESAN
jgi:hypothetical protein